MVKIISSGQHHQHVSRGGTITFGTARAIQSPPTGPVVLLQALVSRDQRTEEGFVVRALEPAWLAITSLLVNPAALLQLSPEQLEELVAASYDKAGYDEVTLTPRSGDGGRDVIAVRKGWGSIRIIDQVKRYSPDHLVTANDVRALLGVLHSDPRASKGVVTTTSSFAPRIESDPAITQFVPYRLELVDGPMLQERLLTLTRSK